MKSILKLTQSEQERRIYERQQAIRFAGMSKWEIKKELWTEGNLKKTRGEPSVGNKLNKYLGK